MHLYAVFILWKGKYLRAVEVLPDVSGMDLNATARRLLEEYQFDALHDPDSCTIYIADCGRLTLVGDEVLK